MPREIIDSEGNTISIPTEEEQAEQSAKVQKAEELEKKLKEVEEEKSLIDWRKVREKEKKLEQQLKSYAGENKIITDDGNVVDKVFSQDDVKKTSEDTTREIIFNTEREKMLLGYDDEQKKVVNFYFDKLSAGEPKTIENLNKFMSEARRISIPESNNNQSINQKIWGGQGQSYNPTRESEVSGAAVNMGKENFGINEDDLKKDSGLEIKL